MSLTLHTIDLTVTLAAPYLVYGSDPGCLGLDAILLRNRSSGTPILPGTLVAGRIADAWNELIAFGANAPVGAIEIPPPTRWFGATAEPGSFAPNPSRLLVDDLFCLTEAAADKPHAHRVEICDETGAAKTGSLLLAEQAHAAGTEVEFKGRWRAWLTPGEAGALRQQLLAGLLWQSQIGAQRSVGFGEMLNATVTCTPLPLPVTPTDLPSTQHRRKRLRLQFDGPIVVDVESRGGNLFVSNDVVPGGAIKAALARMLKSAYGKDSIGECGDRDALAAAFDQVRLTHAFPSTDASRRPARLPLSLVAGRDGDRIDVRDAIDCAEATLIDGRSPAFQIDWKDDYWSFATKGQCWGETTPHLRVRTEIDDSTRRAKDERLFAYECKLAKDGTTWLADIDLPGELSDADACAVWAAVTRMIAHGLGPLGKTDAWAHAELLDDSATVWPSLPAVGPRFVLQLQTPALLFAANAVADRPAVDLQGLYRSAFRDISRGALALSHFFASQTLSGGEYLWHRFIHSRGSGYLPFVLTNVGSVFVLQAVSGREADARSAIERWCGHGLPLPEAVQQRHGAHWNTNPYIPQNGYGEVAVNLQHGLPMLAAPRKE